MNTVVNVRIDKKTKAAASKVFADLGMDLSTGVKVYLAQVATEKGLPFTPTKNPAALVVKWGKENAEAIRRGKRYKSGQEALADL